MGKLKKPISIFLATVLMSICILIVIPTNATAYPYVSLSDSIYTQGTNSVEITVSFSDTGYYDAGVGVSEFTMSGSWGAESSGTPSGAMHYDRLGNGAVYVPCTGSCYLNNPSDAGTYKVDVSVHVYLETIDPVTGGTGWGEGGWEDFTLYFTFIPPSPDDSSSASDSGNDVSHDNSKNGEENQLPILGEMEQYLLVIIIVAIAIAVIMLLPSKKKDVVRTTKKLELLEERLLRGEISEETYKELKRKYEQE